MNRFICSLMLLSLLFSADSFSASQKRKKKTIQKTKQTRTVKRDKSARVRKAPKKITKTKEISPEE